MKFSRSAVLVLILAQSSAAFLQQPRATASVRAMSQSTAASAVEGDVSIPYDAAARLAYDEWRNQFNKGDFDEVRYPNFKANYEAITVANVVAKKRARETGSTEPLPLMTLNEFGDYSEEEYKQAMNQGGGPNVLDTALESAKVQSEASSALSEAADALAEEEEVSEGIIGSRGKKVLWILLNTLFSFVFFTEIGRQIGLEQRG